MYPIVSKNIFLLQLKRKGSNSFSNSKEKETKKEQKHKKARNIFLLANNLELYTFLSLLSSHLYFLILHIHVVTSYYHFIFHFSFSFFFCFLFCKTGHAKMLVSHLCMRFCTYIKFYLLCMMNFEVEISQNCTLARKFHVGLLLNFPHLV